MISFQCKKKFRGLLHISKEIKNDNILLQNAEVEQKQFESEIGKIKEGIQRQVRISVRYKKNIENLYNSRQKVIDLFNDYAKLKSKAV